jgi:Uncharacterized conserved protein (DUF2190)
MTTLKNAGNRINYTNNTGLQINSGQVIPGDATNGDIAIAVDTIPAAAGSVGAVCVGGYPEGVHTLTKHVGEIFTFLQVLYWDNTNLRLTGTSSGNYRAGRSDGVYNSAATTAGLILNKE